MFEEKLDQKSRGCVTVRGESFNEEQFQFVIQLT